MNILRLLMFGVLCVHLSYQQQFNRQQQGATHSLTYSDSDFGAGLIPPTTTTTTIAPDTTTKKKGFFSGFAGFFKGKDESTTTLAPTTSTTTQRSTSSTTTTTTQRSSSTTSTTQRPTSSTSTTQRSSSTTTNRVNQPTQSTSTTKRPQQPPSRDEFPALPSPGRPQNQPPSRDEFPALPSSNNNQPPAAQQPNAPNAWNVRPQIPTIKPVNTFTQIIPTTSTTTTTRRPSLPQNTPKISDGPVTDAELLTLSESLFSKDINNPFRYVTVNYQGRTQSSATNDAASQPFLQIDEKLYAMNTVSKMKVMFDNYEQDTSINEYVLPIERKEENDFIDAVLSTPVMRHAMSFLQQKGIVTLDPATHKDLLKTLWFGMYSRGLGKISSSGFEHVFMSEIKDGSVIGLHNWIYFSEEEKENDLDYKGWLKKIDLGNKGQIAKVRFSLNNLDKPVNSLFIGTSPELELAVYTVCFELRADQECRMAYGGKDFNIVTHSYKYRGKNLIGSAYPEI